MMRYMRSSDTQETTWRRTVIPVLAAIGLGASLVLGIVNFNLLTGGSQTLSNALLVVIGGIFVAGVLTAAALKRLQPSVYQRIGRQ
ncbi:hypothetical protein ASE19_11875 [Nocardioides sp. Root79]|nr:hypothetical protein ASE19_11875 [Nocardioides sp. Root79]